MICMFKVIHYVSWCTWEISKYVSLNIDPVRPPSAPELAWQAAPKKTKVKLDLLTDIDILSMVVKVSEEEYVTLFINMQKLITNRWKIMIKI